MPKTDAIALHRFARNAMATRFEIVIEGSDAVALRAAAEEAFDEIERCEAQLSLFRETSDISRINTRAGTGPVKLPPPIFALLSRAKEISEQTSGAFDIAVGPLMRCWGLHQREGRIPTRGELNEALARSGCRHLELDVENSTAQLSVGAMLDLGAVGKGFAVERAANLLRDSGIEAALIHGGTSTIYGIGAPRDSSAWQVTIRLPDGNKSFTADAELCDSALSVSAPSGKILSAEGREIGHIIDPRNGEPIRSTTLAAVISASALESDALSTALLVGGPEMIETLLERFGCRSALVVGEDGSVHAKGLSVGRGH